MALQTKTIQGNDSLGRSYTLKLYLSEDSTSVTNNTSTITYSLTLYSGGWNYGQYGTGYNVYINGTRVAYCEDNGIYTSISKNSSLSVCSGTTTVTHNSDGTKTISISAYFGTSSSGAGTGDINISGTWTLTAIPRESNVSLSNGTLGTAQNITITPHVSTYKHTLKYTCGNASATIASNLTGSTSGFTYSWTPPLSLAAQNTTGTSVSVKITCETYSGSTLIGSKDTTVTMAMPASIKPTVTATLSDNNGYVSTYGAYIQNKSKLKVVLSISNSQGATTSSYSIKVGNRLTYSTYPSGGLVTDFLPESGSVSVQVTVTDSRGRSGSISATSITVAPYSAPSITSVGIYRSDSSGNASASGAYATVTFKATVSPISVSGTNKNTATYKLQYKLSSSSSWTESTLTSYSNNYSVTNGKTTFGAAVASSYDARITITDVFGTVTSVVVKVQSASTYFKVDVPNNALSLGILETTPNTFRCGWNAIFDGQTIATGQYNRFEYMPYSFDTAGTDGSDGYARIATITIKPTVGTFASMPIKFEIARRYDSRTINLYLRFAHVNNTDPTIESLYFDGGYGGLYNTSFSAFAYRVNAGVYDVYVAKESQWGYVDVWSYIPPFMSYRLNLSYNGNQLTTIPNNAVMAQEVALANRRKYNVMQYMPYSFVTSGGSNTAGYARIASIQITGTWNYTPNNFTIQRLTDKRPITLSLFFRSESNTTPLDVGLYYDGLDGVDPSYPFDAFVYSPSASTLDVYVKKVSASDVITVTSKISGYTQDRCTITYANALLASVPSGATMATPVPCQTPTVTITKTSGNSTASSVAFERSGNVCHLSFNLTTSASTSVGGNVFVGTTTAPKPIKAQTNASYYGSSVLITDFGASGTLTVRVNGASLASGVTAYCNVIYLTNK